MSVQPLGRREPTTFRHVELYPLTAAIAAETGPQPGVLGVNWYSNFDQPTKGTDGRYWIGRGSLGGIRGGHAICWKSKPPDADGWHAFYNQGAEGACVGFSCSRMMSHFNRVRYDGRWLYHEAQRVDYWPGGAYPGASPVYEGTAISAAFDVLRSQGHKTPTGVPKPAAGISANRWITDAQGVIAACGLPLAQSLGAVPLMNSWGTFYPRIVWMPAEVLQRLLDENGEAGTVTDR